VNTGAAVSQLCVAVNYVIDIVYAVPGTNERVVEGYVTWFIENGYCIFHATFYKNERAKFFILGVN
jgi:hypothetical protein